MNILIKLTCLVGLVIAPILGGHESEKHSMLDEKVETEVVLEVNTLDEENSYLTLTTTEKVLDQVTEKIEKCSGSKEEILLKLAEIESENVDIDKMIVTKS